MWNNDILWQSNVNINKELQKDFLREQLIQWKNINIIYTFNISIIDQSIKYINIKIYKYI